MAGDRLALLVAHGDRFGQQPLETVLLQAAVDIGERMGEAARRVVRERFLTTRELEDHLHLLGRLAA